MPLKYYEESVGAYSDQHLRLRSFAQVIDNLSQTKTPPAAVKTLTIVFKTVS